MMKTKLSLLLAAACLLPLHLTAEENFPVVPEDMEVSLFARDPLVRNPCVITFDARGRLCVGMGPQYRTPKPETSPDSVWIVTDEDGDGVAETRQEFATGFNAIQGLAWKGDWLWIANAPELTRVRDTDGDDVADEYIRVYTDLGNLEHALHGLNFGPDGRLYMSKGNSKGLTQVPDRIAPKPFRELWGVEVPAGTPEPQPRHFTAGTYEKDYQDPRDDWGVTGGILRCADDGSDLEIVARGFRNPWDMAFDDGFHWLGTDNDQTMGDKIFAPFYGAHFGWGHAWSYDWKGDDHLPTAPSSGPLFEGSGAGVIWSGVEGYPEKYQDVFLINDWLNRETLIYRTRWDGAWRKPDREPLEVLAHADGGRSMPLSDGRAFDPVDVEMGPDGAIWISSWGRQYGAHHVNGTLANEGRVYRLWPRDYSPALPERNAAPIANWTSKELIRDLGSHVPSWRSNAQEELIRRGESMLPALEETLKQEDRSQALETWAVWTTGRIDPSKAWHAGSLNQRVQSLRLQAYHGKVSPEVVTAFEDPEPRIRLEAVLAIREAGASDQVAALLERAKKETDRIVYYAVWGALTDLASVEERRDLLTDAHPRLRLAAFLSLLEEDAIPESEIAEFTQDTHLPLAELAARRVGGKHEFEQRGRPIVATTSTAMSVLDPMVIPFEDLDVDSGHRYEAGVLQSGQRLYTDRDYRITKVPAELEGLTFLRTACSDAERKDDQLLTLNLRYPATVYFIDDARAEALPAWAQGQWKETSLQLEGDDPKLLKVHEATLPAGPLRLGGGRQGIRARKGNYVIAFRPDLLTPQETMSTAENVLPLLSTADPDRGRDLFFSKRGANCASCHEINGHGNNHAPDLSEIASRATPEVLLESILQPSASIVEGFSAQLVVTKSGESHAGITLQETGRAITVALTGGDTVEILRRDIESQEALPISAMPAGFGALLSSQQLADLVAWLGTLQKPDRLTLPEGEFRFKKEPGKLHLYLGETRIATYLIQHEDLTRRAFVNLQTPRGIPVTRQFPPQRPEDLDPGYRGENGIIHPVMHPGLWMSFGWIDGNDYWRLTSPVVHERFLDEPTSDGNVASFRSRDRYLSANGEETICLQDTEYRFRIVEGGILLEWDAEFYNEDRVFTFGDQEESGLALRIASPLRVQGGNGRIINDRGEQNGAGTWGKEFQWINYSGEVEDRQVGLLVMPHPDNPRTCWSHSRDYGALVSNPFPKQPKERRKPYVTRTIKKGERFRLRYSVLIHEVDAASFNPAALAERFLNP